MGLVSKNMLDHENIASPVNFDSKFEFKEYGSKVQYQRNKLLLKYDERLKPDDQVTLSLFIICKNSEVSVQDYPSEVTFAVKQQLN